MIGRILHALFGQRRFDVEVTFPDGRQLTIRGLPERHLDFYIDASADKGRSVRILNTY